MHILTGCFPSWILGSPVLVEGVGDELGIKGDVREAVAILDSADHSGPGNNGGSKSGAPSPLLSPNSSGGGVCVCVLHEGLTHLSGKVR